MRYLYRGTTLGVFFFLFSTIYSYDDWNQATTFAVDFAAPYEHQSQFDNQQNQSGFTFYAGANNSALRGVMRSYINSPEYQQACLQAAQEEKDKQKAEAEEHLEKFGVTKEELWGEGRSCGIFSGSFDDVSRRICQMNVDKKQALAIWHEYCTQKRTKVWFLDELKEEGRQKILKEYEKREKREKQEKQRQDNLKKQEEQKRQQHYQHIYHENIIAFSDEQSPYLNDRQLALQQTKDDNYQQHEKSYEFDDQVTGFMKSQGVDLHQFQSLSGTIFQHQLFGEVANYYKKAAKIVYEYQIKHGFFVPTILQFGQCAFRATSLEQFGLAIQLNDLSDFMAETSLSICKGAIRAPCNLIDLAKDSYYLLEYCIKNPVDIAQKLGTMLLRVTQLLGDSMTYADSSEIGWSYHADRIETESTPELQYFCEVMNQCEQWCKQSSLQDKIELGSQLICDSMLFSMLGKAYSIINTQTQEMIFLQNLTDISVEYSLATQLGEVGIHSLEDLTVSLLESEADVIRRSKAIQDIVKNAAEKVHTVEKQIVDTVKNRHTVLQDFKKYGAKSRPAQREVRSYFNDAFHKDELLKFCEKAIEQYSEIEILDQGKKAILNCKPEHIMSYNLNFKLNKDTGLYEGFISGGHVGIYRKPLEKSGEIIVVSEQQLAGGARAVEYKHKFGSFIEKKTEYSLTWSSKEIMESIKKAWHNQIYSKPEGPLLKVIGTGKDDVLIEMYVKKLANGKLTLKTAYPYYKKFSGTKL